MSALPIILSALIALAGSGGIVFGALRYNRDEAGKIVAQQTAVMTNMQALNTELQGALERSREDTAKALAANAELISELQKARTEIGGLRVEMKRLHKMMEASK